LGALSTYTNTYYQYRGRPGTIVIVVPSTTTTTTVTVTSTPTTITITATSTFVKRHAFGYILARATAVTSYPTTVTCSQHVDVYTTTTITKTASTVKATSTTTVQKNVSVTGTTLTTTQLGDSTSVRITTSTSVNTVTVTSTSTSTTTTTVVSSTVSTVITTATTLPDQTCLTDNVNHPVLDFNANNNGYTGPLTPESCSDFCYDKIYEYAGLFNGDTCLCGDSINMYTPTPGSTESSSGIVVDQSFCYNQCAGNSADACGGDQFVLFYNAAPTVAPVQPCEFTRSSMKAAKMRVKRHLGWMQEYIPESVVRGHAKAEDKMVGAFAWFHKTDAYESVYIKYMRMLDEWRDSLSERGITTEKVGL